MVGQIAIGLDRHQSARRGQPVEGLAKVLTDDPTHARCLGDHAIERAILLDPLHRGLGADLGHAWHIVDCIAHQGQPIDDALGRHAESRSHALAIEPLGRRIVPGHGVDQGHMVIDQLRHVLIAGGHHRADALAPGALGQGANDVVGLDARHHDERPAHGPHHLVDGGNLQHQVGRR